MVPLKHRQPDHTPSNRPTSRARYAEDSWANLTSPLPYGNPMARRRFSTRRSEAADITTTTTNTVGSDKSVILEEAQASVTRYYAQAKELDDQLATVRQERNGLLAKIQELQASHEKQLDTLIVRIDEQQKLIKRYQSLGDVDELEHLQDDDTVHLQQLREYKDRVLRLEEELSKAKDLAQDDRDDALAYENMLVERNNQINTLQADNEQQARKIAHLEQQVQAEKSTESVQVQQLREYKDHVRRLEKDLADAKMQAEQDKSDMRAYENALAERDNELDGLHADTDQKTRTIAELERRMRDAEQAEKDATSYKSLMIERNSKINALQVDNDQLSRKIVELEGRVRDSENQVKTEKNNESVQAQQLREHKERLLRLEEDLTKAKDQAKHERDDAMSYKNALAECNSQVDALQANIEQQSRTISRLEQRVRDAEQQAESQKNNHDEVNTYKDLLSERSNTISTLQDDNEQLSRKITRFEQRIRDVEQQAQEEKKIMEGQVEEITESYKETVREMEDLKQELAHLVTEKEKAIAAYDQTAEEMDELRQELTRLVNEKEKATAACERTARELDELRQECQRVMTEKKKIANELERANSTLKHAQKKDDIINTLYAARSNLSRELTETASHLNHMAEEAARREQQLSNMEEARRQELSAAKEHERELTDKIVELEETMSKYERQLSDFGKLEKQVQDQNAYIDELQDALHERESRANEVQHAADMLQDELAHSKEALDKALVRVERLEDELNSLNDERRKKAEQIARLHSAVTKAEGDQKSLEAELSSRQQELKRLVVEREEAMDQVEQAEKDLAEAHRTIDNLEKHLQEANATSRIQEEERVIRIGQLERSVERILEDLELTRKQLGDAERVRGALQDEVRRLRTQIKEHEDLDEDRARSLARSQRKLAALQEENKNWLLQLQQAETEAVRLRQVLGELTKYGEEALAQ